MRELVVTTIRAVLRILDVIAPRLGVALAFRLFCQPAGRSQVRGPERAMMASAQTESITVNGHEVRIYRWGSGANPVLLVHGWESRGARFAPLAEKLQVLGYSPITFDSPGHGDSKGDRTTILDYLVICQALHQRYGSFEAIVAHSFGSLCAFYALKQNVQARCIVAISGVSDFRYLLDAFSAQLGLSIRVKARLERKIERLFAPLDNIWSRFSVTHEAQGLQQQVFVVHDIKDDVVDLGQAHLTLQHFGKRARRLFTDGLGHTRILYDAAVLDNVCAFIQHPDQTSIVPEAVVPASSQEALAGC